MKDGVFSHTKVTEMVNQLCYMKDGVFRHTTVTDMVCQPCYRRIMYLAIQQLLTWLVSHVR